MPLVEAAAALPPGTLVLGDAAAVLAVGARAPGVRAGPEESGHALPSLLGLLGLRDFLGGGAPDPASVVPLYLQAPPAVPRNTGRA